MAGDNIQCSLCGAPLAAAGQACPACFLRMALPDQATARSSSRDAADGVEFGQTTPGPAGVAVADRIGPYRILEEVGEGGMGTVYLAEQDVPIRRRVALKVIKLGMDTREVVSRFEAERQALAIMSHPAIAQVFDAGSTPLGRPFFAMEYVPGESITAYWASPHNPAADRALFRSVRRRPARAPEGHHSSRSETVQHSDQRPGWKARSEDHRLRTCQGPSRCRSHSRHFIPNSVLCSAPQSMPALNRLNLAPLMSILEAMSMRSGRSCTSC
jgi:serine/threonine protein kinase